MSHDDAHPVTPHAKLIRMANQIGTFFESKPHEEGVAGVAEHINKFWEPRMRRHLFEVVDAGGEGLKPIVLEASASIRRPVEERQGGVDPAPQASERNEKGRVKPDPSLRLMSLPVHPRSSTGRSVACPSVARRCDGPMTEPGQNTGG